MLLKLHNAPTLATTACVVPYINDEGAKSLLKPKYKTLIYLILTLLMITNGEP